MLHALKFASAAVGKRAYVEGTTHFVIKDGLVRATNGVIALAAPIPLQMDCAPQAIPMVKAIANCEDATQMTLLGNGKLSIKSGKFRAVIPCTDKLTAHVDPEGEVYQINGAEFIEGLKRIAPFIGTDASRPFSTTVLVQKGSAFATNNVILCQYWFGSPFPLDIVLSSATVEALIKIKQIPVSIQVSEQSATFHYESGCWLRSATVDNKWPLTLEKMLSVECNAQTVDPSVFEALERLKPFATENGRVYLENGCIRTHFEENEGASCLIEDVSLRGVYALDMLMLLKDTVDTADLTKYPAACPFFGKNLRGVIIGQRL